MSVSEPPIPVVEGSAPRRWTISKLVRAAILVGALVHPCVSLLSRYVWLADLITHFQEPALAVTVVAAAVWLRKSWRVAAVLAVLAAFQVVPLVRYSGANPIPPDASRPERLRILLSNVLHDNRQLEDLALLIRTEKPDVVGLVEYGARCHAALAEFDADYPYRREYLGGAGGVALWFRKPPLSLDGPEWLAMQGNSVVHGTFEFAGKTRHIWVAHPTSPLFRVFQPGNPEMTALARRVGGTKGSRIVIGDMNCSDGSTHFSDFLRTTGLRDSRLGFGRQPSWPTEFPYRIAIDHVFVDEDLAVVSRRLGHKVGSDHGPGFVELAPAARKSNTQDSQASTATP